ncbi:hypothetical protein GPECTOR_100g4 [Gonium pectorale]|uniref:Uncharacterized protein n=1 Tax=Gonium pectorale TaxID=33097 RepID=A0A150G000_GONPE|nr:hypothetical protein GPECTOR_100g4 [Gonium pectorale]|eukprot:KXZ43151.1 hypothetical protein GPECTOR_100g4 [Gonium pectorale]
MAGGLEGLEAPEGVKAATEAVGWGGWGSVAVDWEAVGWEAVGLGAWGSAARVAQVVLEAAVVATVELAGLGAMAGGLEGLEAPEGVKAATEAVGWGATVRAVVGWEAWDSVDAEMGEGQAVVVGDLQAGDSETLVGDWAEED